jgi:hypothetical protein
MRMIEGKAKERSPFASPVRTRTNLPQQEKRKKKLATVFVVVK